MQNRPDDGVLVAQIRQIAQPLADLADLDPLIDAIGDARFVLLGEASHGTSEYYAWRARLSERLIAEKGFDFVAVEGDWPDCYQVNRYAKGYPESGENAYDVLYTFDRWPTWMWANYEVVGFIEWLRAYNQGRERKAGFFGLDVYSLWESMYAIIDYLQDKDPEAAEKARQAYQCFEPYGEDVQAYAWSTRMVPEDCEDEVIELLLDLRRKSPSFDDDIEGSFNAEQNALVMVDAERYYRAMVRSDQNSWNVRDIHMADTFDRLIDYHGDDAKGIVWAHNTHVGDARATDMARGGMVNIGQLVRERHADEGVMLIGFGSHRGSVIAGDAWDAPMERMRVPPGRPDSWEDVLHQAGGDDKLLLLKQVGNSPEFQEWRGHRAIGVVYDPERESFGNYVPSVLSQRYDAFLFIDETRALHPLHIEPEQEEEMPETFPWGV